MEHEVMIEKLIFGGKALARIEGKPVFVWDALPGEIVKVRITKEKKSYYEGEVLEILEKSKERIIPQDPNYLAASPWDMMTFECETKWKQNIALETYKRIGKIDLENIDIESDEKNQYHYRNKINFRITKNAEGEISLAEMQREQNELIPLKEVKIAHTCITKTAGNIIDWLNKENVPVELLKSIVLRSNKKEQVIAVLFMRDEFEFGSYPELNDMLRGFHIYLSDALSDVSTPDMLFYSFGDNTITENILGTDLQYGLLNFFQVNVPLFEKALEDIKKFLDPKKEAVDYYSGVGAISLPLAKYAKKWILVENDTEAVVLAAQNVQNNHVDNVEAYAGASEDMPEWITKDRVIVFDPPRAGLHPHIIKKILDTQPERIIYLSCNISTQARDMALLSEKYIPKFTKLYNFFPRTPHIEGLVVLDKK